MKYLNSKTVRISKETLKRLNELSGSQGTKHLLDKYAEMMIKKQGE